MIKKFLINNKLAIKNSFKWMSIILTSIVLIIFTIGFLNNQKPDLALFLTVVLSAGIGFPIFGIMVGFLKWWRDYFVTNRNFNSIPFNQLESIGFRKVVKNENSKSKFTSEYFNGKIGDFIVDCDVDTQNDHKILRFKFYSMYKPFDKDASKIIQDNFEKLNGFIDFNWITKQYHFKNHRLKTISDLKKELIEFSDLIINENISPHEIARR